MLWLGVVLVIWLTGKNGIWGWKGREDFWWVWVHRGPSLRSG